ncbi:UNVERIFIED_ORG: hypothetical protein FNL38_10566 [Nocardia globerula]|uniref:Uncharacterized protein n=1 Tax=Nocardia globerula TaxID=1818 RepID=A0A652YMU0_NOCGL
MPVGAGMKIEKPFVSAESETIDLMECGECASPVRTCPAWRSVFVVVLTMCGVSMAIVDVVRVIAVRNGDVATPFAVDVIMAFVDDVLRRLTFVDMIAVGTM